MGSVQQNGEKLIRVFALAYQPPAASIQSINQFCWYQAIAFMICVPSRVQPFTKSFDFNKCVQHECMRYCNGVPLVHVEPYIA